MNRRKFKLSSTLLAVLIASLANAADTSSWGHGYAFLYRSYSGAKPAWVSAHTGNINHQANTDVIEVKRPFHLGSTIFTVFDGNGSLAGISPITTRDANGRTSFTIQAFCYPTAVNGSRFLFTNYGARAGVELKILDGRLHGAVGLENGNGGSIKLSVMSGSVVANRWVRVALRGKEMDGAFSIRLYIDGEEVAVNQRPSAYSKVNGSFLLPVVGRTASSQNRFFEGMLYSVSLRNYAAGISRDLELPFQGSLLQEG